MKKREKREERERERVEKREERRESRRRERVNDLLVLRCAFVCVTFQTGLESV